MHGEKKHGCRQSGHIWLVNCQPADILQASYKYMAKVGNEGGEETGIGDMLSLNAGQPFHDCSCNHHTDLDGWMDLDHMCSICRHVHEPRAWQCCNESRAACKQNGFFFGESSVGLGYVPCMCRRFQSDSRGSKPILDLGFNP